MIANRQIMNNMPKIRHLYNAKEKRWHTHAELIEKNIKLNYLEQLSLKAAIPKEWLRSLNVVKYDNRQKTIRQKLEGAVKISQFAYFHLLDNTQKRYDHFRNSWEVKLNQEISNHTWETAIERTYRLTQCTKLRSFQYRLLNNALITNVNLQHWRMRSNSDCTFCKDQAETVLHLLVECSTVRTVIWEPFKKWLNYFCYIDLMLESHILILNDYKDSFPDMVNTIILITKQYIYAARCLNEHLSFSKLISKIHLYKMIEKVIANRNKSVEKISGRCMINCNYLKQQNVMYIVINQCTLAVDTH